MGLFDFRNPNKRKKSITGISIHCDPKVICINDVVISFPTSYTYLQSILGTATRIEAVERTKNKVYIWDEIGVYCSSPDPEKMLMILLVLDNRYGLGHQPKENFEGIVLIDGQPTDNTLQNVGVDRPYIIRSIIKEQQKVAIAIGWNPGI